MNILSRERTIAPPGFNRWLVPPAALAVHLCIGMVYGLSVFWLPLSQSVGLTHSVACPRHGTLFMLTATQCDWSLGDLKPTFTLAIVVLGASAALWGGWLERAGPRKAGLVAAICWPGGLAIMTLGVALHQLWLMWLGGGVIGGIGLGLGYISPVSTLIKWFPDRRGLATGLAIMGFGGGAMIGAPLATLLMGAYRGPSGVGVWQTLLTLAAIYAVFLTAGAFGYRVPPDSQEMGNAGAAAPSVPVWHAHKTPQFWLLWAMLCLNVSAGIGVLEMASPMLQEIFGGRLIGAPAVGFAALSPAQAKAVAAVAAGFIGFLSLFNILGRFFWASLSDRLGRRGTFSVFFLLGAALYAVAPQLAHAGQLGLFAAVFALILSMYGGGFATIPAYLADLFGPSYVGAIHGRLLTAWSAAGLIGPEIINDFRESELAAGLPRQNVYDHAMLVLACLLVAGFLCTMLLRPVATKWFSTALAAAPARGAGVLPAGPTFRTAVLLPWIAVGLPLAWGFWRTLLKASALFL
jgi:MFS family permease